MPHLPNVSHLSAERLAALGDESPTAAEMAHLTGCAECARERAVYQSLAELASAESARIGMPLTRWETLAPALVADRIIDGMPAPVRHKTHTRPWLQAAAAVLLVAGGMMAGRSSVGAPPIPFGDSNTVAVVTPSTDSLPHFESIEQARAAQAQSQLLFQTATSYLAQQDTANHSADTPSAMRTRLAALDRAREVMGEALNEAPYDPVINGYYLTTLGQREATLRQLNTAMPANMRLTSY